MKWWKWVLLVLAVAFVAIQFVRPSLGNPPVDEAKTIDATAAVPADVHAMLERSCYDCHSNKSAWPWYSRVAPVSWLIAKDVRQGRKELNFSEWGTYKPRRKSHKLEELCEQVNEKKMPLKVYLPLHPRAKLSDADRTRLCEWANALRGDSPKSEPHS
jgi:heme-binding protein